MAAARSGRAPVVALETDGLLVRAIPYGEADLVAQFFTARYGRLSAMVRGARRSKKRAAGGLEPFHTLHLRLDDRGADLCTLRESEIGQVRAGLVASLPAMDAGGRALRWARTLFPPRVAEPEAWSTLVGLLDALDAPDGGHAGAPSTLLAWAGLRLLASAGFGLELEACIVCEKVCPEGRRALVDVARGGVVCTGCGGGALSLPWPVRRAAQELSRAGGAGEVGAGVAPSDAAALLELVARAMEHHALGGARA